MEIVNNSKYSNFWPTILPSLRCRITTRQSKQPIYRTDYQPLPEQCDIIKPWICLPYHNFHYCSNMNPHVLAPVLDVNEKHIYMEGTITSAPRSAAPEGVWVPGWEMKVPCKYVLHGSKKSRDNARKFPRKRRSKNKSRRLKLAMWLFVVSMYVNIFTTLNNTHLKSPWIHIPH